MGKKKKKAGNADLGRRRRRREGSLILIQIAGRRVACFGGGSHLSPADEARLIGDKLTWTVPGLEGRARPQILARILLGGCRCSQIRLAGIRGGETAENWIEAL